MGSALPSKVNVQAQLMEQQINSAVQGIANGVLSPEKKKGEETYEVRKTKTRTLLTNKKEIRPSSKAGARLEKLPEKTLTMKSTMFDKD